jgi:DNA-binding transcriptional LysR family regulator
MHNISGFICTFGIDSGMDLKRFRAFVAVAEQGTVSAAAQVLHVTQPALSRQITGLERKLGFKLFARLGRRLVLTELGEQLLADARILLSQVAALGERAQALRTGDIAMLNVAASALTIEGLFPTFLHRYAEAVPGVRLNVIEAHADQHLAMLERGDAHLAINVVNVVHVDDHRFASHLLPQFHVLAACTRSFDLDPGATIDIRRLAEYPLLLPNASYATRSLFDAACRVADVRPNILVESEAAHALLALAEAGHGVAVIPSILRPDHRSMRALRVTHGRKSLDIDLAVIWDKQHTVPHYAEQFSDLLTEHILVVFAGARLPGAAAIEERQGVRMARAG